MLAGGLGLDRDNAGGANARRSNLLFAGDGPVVVAADHEGVDIDAAENGSWSNPARRRRPEYQPEHELPTITLAPS